jgi:hypothetical protein
MNWPGELTVDTDHSGEIPELYEVGWREAKARWFGSELGER